MRYLKVLAPVFSTGKEKKIKVTEEFANKPMRDSVADNLFSLLTVEYDKAQGKYVQKHFADLDAQKNLHRLKEKILFSNDEIVELGNDLFAFLKTNFDCKNFDASVNDQVVALSDMLDACEKQSEEAAEKELKESKGKALTVKAYHEKIGLKVEIVKEEKK